MDMSEWQGQLLGSVASTPVTMALSSMDSAPEYARSQGSGSEMIHSAHVCSKKILYTYSQ